MAETLKRHRETAARMVLLVSTAYILVSLADLGYQSLRGDGFVEAARQVGGSSLSVVMCLLVLASTLACALLRPATTKARSIVRLGAVVVSTATALELLFLLVGLFGGRFGAFGAVLELLGGLLEVAVKGAISYLLWRTLSGAEQQTPAVEAPPASFGDQADPLTSASWSADQAAGAVWTRAGDAASGAAASTWGHPGARASGWQVDGPTQQLADAPVADGQPGSQAGPWATAGQLAQGRAGIELPDTDTPAATAGQVSWAPAPRDR